VSSSLIGKNDSSQFVPHKHDSCSVTAGAKQSKLRKQISLAHRSTDATQIYVPYPLFLKSSLPDKPFNPIAVI